MIDNGEIGRGMLFEGSRKMDITIIKVHGSNNDFYLIDEMETALPLTDEQRGQLAINMCKRTDTEGADGILFVMSSKTSDAKMRIFNSDGSEASMCGNGLRCVGRYVEEKLKKNTLKIETMKANLQVKKEPDMYENIPTYRVEISPVIKNTSALPMNTEMEEIINQRLPFIDEDLTFSTLSVPNPHLISLVDKDVIHSDRQEKIATKLNGENDWFTDGVNVSFVYRLEEGAIFVRTFERGVGFTNACGTAMSASSLVTKWIDELDDEVLLRVYNPGGMVMCQVHDLEEKTWIDLIGNATYEYSTSIQVNMDTWNIKFGERKTYTDEAKAYLAFQKDIKAFVESKMG